VDAAVVSLTKREQEVLAHLAEGGRVATVAKALFVSPHTVRNHLRSIFAKLGVHSQPELLEHVRENPEVLGAATPLPMPRTRENLIREYHEADRKLTERIAKALLKPPGSARVRAILHEALPLDAERAREWRTRLDLWCLASDAPELAKVHRKQVDRRMALMQERIRNAQRDGWVQPDLDPLELAQMLHSLILSATIQLLQHPSSQDAQLRIIDAYVDSVTAE
jgi:DNA-binding CsgD family transcriptional regulator